MTDFVRSLLRNIEHQSATLLYFGITVTKSKLMVDIQSPAAYYYRGRYTIYIDFKKKNRAIDF